MSPFTKLKRQFVVNWNTVLVGWKGLGVFSPWPTTCLTDYPPLLSADELAAYAYERLTSSSNAAEDDLVVRLLCLDLHTECREAIIEHLMPLSDLYRCDSSREIQKWQVILLEDLLDHIPSDPTEGLIALTEFWQSFGYPTDSPHEVQGRENTINPYDYYQEENYHRLVSRHKTWIEQEKARLLVS